MKRGGSPLAFSEGSEPGSRLTASDACLGFDSLLSKVTRPDTKTPHVTRLSGQDIFCYSTGIRSESTPAKLSVVLNRSCR